MATETSTSLSQGLFDTSVTLKMLEKNLQEGLKTSATFGPNVSVEQIAKGEGFLSVMLRLKADWQGDNTDQLPKSFVVKIPSSVTSQKASKDINLDEMAKSAEADAQFSAEGHVNTMENYLRVAHACETAFYEMVNRDHIQLKVPQCYYIQNYGISGENGVLIMQDLCDVAQVKPMYEAFSCEGVKNVIDNIAEIHAYSLKHHEWLENDNLKATIGKFQKASDGHFEPLIIGLMDILKKDYPTMFDPLIDRLREQCSKDLNLSLFDTLHEELGFPPVLTHGDMWTNNMMWRKAADGKGSTDELVAVVDWQLVHPGCVGEDFVRLLGSSVDPTVRREHLTDFFEHYHASLKSKLGKEPPFTVAQLIHAYKRMFRYGVAVVLPQFIGFIQLVLPNIVDKEDVEKNRDIVLNRAKCLIEDVYAYDEELARDR